MMMNKEVQQKLLMFMKNRRTIRKFKNISIDSEVLEAILGSAQWAPSAHNSQPWKFVVVTNMDFKKKLVNNLRSSCSKLPNSIQMLVHKSIDIVDSAPVVVFAYNTKRLSKKMIYLGEPYLSISNYAEIESISAAIQNMLLMAYAYGVGSAWLNMILLIKDQINESLGETSDLVSLVGFGYPDEKPKAHSRVPIDKIIRHIK
ncbi:MAG: nitroreductase family protein [Candidatus Omnitrophica bacterium]|nr:nitroreductase family protein [Candidatus Omnitrophota bacterium]